METKRIVISQAKKRVNRPKGSAFYILTEEVVYKTQQGNHDNGKPFFATSRTVHEKVK